MGKPKRTPRRLRLHEAAYLAGIVDADGHIGVAGGNGRNKDCFSLRLTVVGMSKDLMRWPLRTTRAGRARRQKRRPRRARVYRWMVSSRQAANLIEQLIPFLIVKQPQAQVALRMREAVGVRTPGARAHVLECVQEIRGLNCNKKGAANHCRWLRDLRARGGINS